jgi:GT2 family glycosyltransferase
MKVLIGFPSNDMLHADFSMSLANICMFTFARGLDQIIGFVNPRAALVQEARHNMVKDALKLDADYILMLDSDMTFPPDILHVLVSSGKDIIGCDYMTRRLPCISTARDSKGNTYDIKKTTGIREVAKLATGCLLVKTKVFKDIGEPYFNVLWSSEKKKFIGEDYNFCAQAKEKGYPIFCNFDISKKIGHIGAITVRMPN